MPYDGRLKKIRRLLIELNHRAGAFAQHRDDPDAPYGQRVGAVMGLVNLEQALTEIKIHNTVIMGNLSKNQQLLELQKENKALRKKLEKYQRQSSDAKGDPAPDGDPAGFDVGDLSVKALRERIKDIDDADQLAALLEDEENGKARKSAVEALQGRINTLNDEPESEPEADGDAPDEQTEDQ